MVLHLFFVFAHVPIVQLKMKMPKAKIPKALRLKKDFIKFCTKIVCIYKKMLIIVMP